MHTRQSKPRWRLAVVVALFVPCTYWALSAGCNTPPADSEPENPLNTNTNDNNNDNANTNVNDNVSPQLDIQSTACEPARRRSQRLRGQARRRVGGRTPAHLRPPPDHRPSRRRFDHHRDRSPRRRRIGHARDDYGQRRRRPGRRRIRPPGPRRSGRPSHPPGRHDHRRGRRPQPHTHERRCHEHGIT